MKGIGTKHVHRVAWVRASPRHPAKSQRAAVMQHAGLVYDEADGETVAGMIDALRPGREVYVHGVHRLAPTRQELGAALAGIHAKGAKLYDTEAQVWVDPGSFEAVVAALGVLLGERRMPTTALARKRGKLGGKPPSLAKVSRAEALAIWRDKSITNEEAARRIGLSVRTCYRRFKDSGREAGWPKRKGK